MALFSLQSFMVGAASVSALLGSKSVHTEIDIPAAPEKVWEVLVDIEQYQQWNPAITLVSGELQIGNKVTYRFQETADKSAEITSRVEAIEPNKRLSHKGGIWGVITFDQNYTLDATDEGTRLTIHEDYTGVYVNFWDETDTLAQYQAMAQALKQRVIELN